jgi:hypothetical protein
MRREELTMSEHAKQLEPKIHRIKEQLKKVTSENHSERLLQIIHRPGWTTPQEAKLVHALLDSVAHHLEGIDRTQRVLIAVADEIGKAKAA